MHEGASSCAGHAGRTLLGAYLLGSNGRQVGLGLSNAREARIWQETRRFGPRHEPGPPDRGPNPGVRAGSVRYRINRTRRLLTTASQAATAIATSGANRMAPRTPRRIVMPRAAPVVAPVVETT